MSVMTTVLTEYSDEANFRTYTVAGHTVAKPRLVLQKRKIGAPGGASSYDNIQVIYGTADAAGVLLSGRVAFEVSLRRPIDGVAADVTAALAVFRDIVASDEFTSMVTTQNYIKA